MSTGHYLIVVLPEGKDEVRREHFPLASEDESADEALARWVQAHPDMIDRQRNRAATEQKIRAEILYSRIARPSSWYRADESRRVILSQPRKRSRA